MRRRAIPFAQQHGVLGEHDPEPRAGRAFVSRGRRRGAVAGTQRREVVVEPGGDELVDALGAGQALQLVLAEVAEVEVGAVRGCEQLVGGMRDEHLPTVTGRADPSGPVDVEADIPAFHRGWLAGVDPDPHAHGRRARPLLRGERPLCGDRSVDGVAGARERDEELVAAAVDLATAGARDRVADDPPVLRHHGRIRIAELLNQAGGVFHVGEEERDDPGREARHAPSLSGYERRPGKPAKSF